ncbi:MAG: Ppx/GppA phosphatase family protein [Gemmatimonadales bacterium]|jgi:exopolyphosphatase/guanosine-5'-triphosphate,3'-diphosphate pyrophosphatase
MPLTDPAVRDLVPPPGAPRVAAIDLGTNSVRLIVAEVDGPDSYQVLDDERVQTRLGFRLNETGRIDSERGDETLDALERMQAIADGFEVDELRAVGTAALREAENGPAFVATARDRFGLEIEIISPEEEAELAMRSVRKHFALGEGASAIVDIGGGSMEVVFTTAGTIVEVHSMPLGAVLLTEQYVHSDPIAGVDWRRLRNGIDEVLRDHIGKPPFPTPDLIGSGGTFTAIGALAMHDRQGEIGPVQGYALTTAELEHQLRRLREAPLALRRRFTGLNADRADIILAGTAAIARLARRLDVSRIRINDRGIRDGLLLEMIARQTPASTRPADRLDAARIFARKCRSNPRHTEQVARLAGQLFDGLRAASSGDLRLADRDRELLVAASLMHDVGYLIRHSGHHKHAYHLIRHSDLDGFAGYELELVANIARYHRKAHPKRKHENWRRVRKQDQPRVRLLSGILRLADGLDRTHAQTVRAIDVREITKIAVTIDVSGAEDPWVEIGDARRKSDLLEKALDRKVVLRRSEATAETT